MQTQIKKLDNLLWINIVQPELLAVRKLLIENGLSESLAEEIVEPTLNAKVDTLRNATYLTLHFPIKRKDREEEVTNSEEVDFLIKNNLIISSQYQEILYLKNYVEKLTFVANDHGGNYFVTFLKSIYDQTEKDLNLIDTNIRRVEKDIFHTDERKVIEEIAQTSKQVFDIRKSYKMHGDVLDVFVADANKVFGFEFLQQSQILKSKLKDLLNIIDNETENIEQIKSITDFLLTNKTNQIVKVFTVVSFILLPMTFLAGFFGMNTKFPSDLVTSTFGTVYIMCFMFFVAVLVLCYLHFKKLI